MTLSKTQLEVLKEMNKENNVLHFMPYMGSFCPNAYWFISNSFNRVRCSTVDKLLKLKLLREIKRDWKGAKVIISTEGEEYLKRD